MEVTESETISSAAASPAPSYHLAGCGDHWKVLWRRNFSPMFEGVWSEASGQDRVRDGEWRSGGQGTNVRAAADCPQSGPAPAAA